MSITIKPSPKFGGDGGTARNDLDFIAKSAGKIKTIDVNQIEAQCGDVVDLLQFTYKVVPTDGLPYNYVGSIHGQTGGTKSVYPFAEDERMTGISGRYGKYLDNVIIKTIKFNTSRNNNVYSCGTYDPVDTPFDLPIGIFYCGSGSYVDSIGTYMYETTQATVTTITTSTIFQSPSTSISDYSGSVPCNSSLIVALSSTTGILGVCFLVTLGIFLWRNFKPKAIPTAGS